MCHYPVNGSLKYFINFLWRFSLDLLNLKGFLLCTEYLMFKALNNLKRRLLHKVDPQLRLVHITLPLHELSMLAGPGHLAVQLGTELGYLSLVQSLDLSDELRELLEGRVDLRGQLLVDSQIVWCVVAGEAQLLDKRATPICVALLCRNGRDC